MKILFQIPILFLLIFIYTIKMTASGAPVFSSEDVEVWVHNVCNEGSSSGKIDLRIMSANGPFQVIYYDEDQNELKNVQVINGNDGEEDLDALSVGNYIIKIIDSQCAVANIEVNIELLPSMEINAELSLVCQVGAGIIIPVITGGEEPFTYNWSNGATSMVISGLDAGTYTLTLTDNTGCKKTSTFNIESVDDVIEVHEDIIASDCAQNNGEIHLSTTIYGEESNEFNYEWAHGPSGNNYSSLFDLSPNEYCVTISGYIPTGCNIIRCYDIPEKSIEIVSNITPNTNCASSPPNGSIELSVPNGTAPYTATWGDNVTGMIRENLRVGPYGVTVTDANGCTSSNIMYVPGTQLLPFTGELSQECSTGLYKIRLQNFPTQLLYLVTLYKMVDGIKTMQNYYFANNGYTITGLTYGNYIIEGSDLTCSYAELNFDLPEPLQITNFQTIENLGCTTGQEDGEITVTFEGGMRPMTFTLGNQTQVVTGNSATFTGLNGGLHYIVFINPSGCYDWTTTFLSWQNVNVSEEIFPANNNLNNGSISLSISGGSGQFSYVWNKNNQFFSNDEDLINLAPGNYNLTLTDLITNCVITKNYYVDGITCPPENKIILYTYDEPKDYCPPGANQNWASCTEGCDKTKVVKLSIYHLDGELIFPFSIHMAHQNGYNETKTITGYPAEIKFFNLPPSFEHYTLTITNPCGYNIVEQVFACLPCTFIEPSSGGREFIINDFNDFRVEITHGCKYNNPFIGPKSKLELTNAERRPYNQKRFYQHQEYTVTWPDLTEAVIKQIWSQGKRVHYTKGKGKYYLNDNDFNGNIKTVKIKRKDGCIRTFNFRIGDVKDVVGIGYSNLPIGDFSTWNKPCKECNLQSIPSDRNFYKPILECNLSYINYESDPNLKYFHYIPNTAGSNPCNGGKLIRHVSSPNGLIENQEEIVDIEAISQITDWFPRNSMENKEKWPDGDELSPVYNDDTGGCVFHRDKMFLESNIEKDMYVNWFRLRHWDYNNIDSRDGCGIIINVTQKGNIIEINIDPGYYGKKLVIRQANQVLQNWNFPHNYKQQKYEFNIESYPVGDFSVQLVNDGPDCMSPIEDVDYSSCPTKFEVIPPIIDINETLQLRTNSPSEHSAIVKFYFEDDLLEELNVTIPAGEGSLIPIIKMIEVTDLNGKYTMKVEIPGCQTYVKDIIVIGGFRNDNPGSLKCNTNIIDISFDSLKNEYKYFFVKPEVDSIYGQTFYYDTIQGYYNEYMSHEIQWDWVKHVRYDSTKTIYYFGTDSIIRSFVTAIDSNGQSNTTWYNDLIFVSCGPLNTSGIWTLIGYKVSEQKYYMYVYDKVNLTALPLDIPNENRGQTYTTVWNFGPNEFATKIISGQFEVVKISSDAYPPFEVSISRPFKIKTVTKWSSNQWLIGGDLKGIMVIGGDTIVSEEWTTTVLIWYDWQGTVIKYKVIESEEDRIITHLATDGNHYIFLAGMEIDTVFHENPDSIYVKTCVFGDTLSIDGIPESYRSQDTWESIAIYTPQSEDPNYIRFYPNPFNQGINVRLDSPHQDDIYLKVIGVLGNTVFEKKWKVSAGLNEIYLKEFEPLPGGLYTIWVKNSKGENAYRLVKIE